MESKSKREPCRIGRFESFGDRGSLTTAPFECFASSLLPGVAGAMGHQMGRQSDGMGCSRSPLGGRCRPSRQVQRSVGSERSRLDRLLLDEVQGRSRR